MYSDKAKFSIENSGTLYSSNVYAKEYNVKTNSIEKAYAEYVSFKNHLEIVKELPVKIPLKGRKFEKDDIVIEFNTNETGLLGDVT